MNVLLVLALAALVSCSAQPVVSTLSPPDTHQPPRERIEAGARRETSVPTAVRIARQVPPPPSVEASLLHVRPASDARAFMSLDAVLEQYGSASAPIREPIATDVSPEQQAEAVRLFVRGRLAAEARDDAEAIDYFEQAAAIDPAAPATQRAIAHAARRLNRVDRALRAYEHLIACEPNDAEALFMFSLGEADQRRYSEALSLAARAAGALRASPSDPALGPLVEFVLARCLNQLGHDRAASEALLACLTTPIQVSSTSPFLEHLMALNQQRPDLLRTLGDLNCRLGEYADAHNAYSAVGSLISPAHPHISARLIYINAVLGRSFAAQQVMQRVLDERGRELADVEADFADYIVQHCAPVDALRDSVLADLPGHSGDARWVRIAAALSPPADRDRIVREFLRDHPKPLGPAYELIRWRWGHDRAAAMRLVLDAVAADPEQVSAHARWCAATLPDATAAIPQIRQLAADSTQTALWSHLHLAFDDPAGAWKVINESSTRASRGGIDIQRVRLEVARALDEVPLILEAADALRRSTELSDQLRVCRALRSVGRTEDALKLVRSLAHSADTGIDVILETAHCLIAHTPTQTNHAAVLALAHEAAALLEEAVAQQPADERIYEAQMSLFGVGGVLHDPEEYRKTFQRFVQSSPESLSLTNFILAETIRQQQFDRTVRVAQRLYNSDPSDREAIEAVVEAWWRMSQGQIAAQWLEVRLADFPSHPALIEQRTRLYLLEGNIDAAQRFIDEVLAREPEHAPARRNLERIRLAQQRYDDVFALAQQRINRRPPGVRRSLELATVALETKHAANAVPLLRSVADNADAAKMEFLTTAMILAFQLDTQISERLPLVERLALAAIERFPAAPVQVYGLGLFALHERVGLSAAFADLADRTVQRDLQENHNPSEQVSSWRQIAQVFVDGGRHEAMSGLLRIRLRHTNAGEHDLTAALCLLIVAIDARLARADASLDLLRELDRLDALPKVWPGIEHEPTFNELLYEVSLIHSTLGNTAGVDLLLSDLLSRQPDHGMASNNLGYLLLEQPQESRRAAALIERAAELRGDDPNVLDSLAWLRYKQGRFTDDSVGEGAYSIMQQALEHATDAQPEVLDHLGDIAWRLGRRDEAIEAWKQVVSTLERPAFEQGVLRSLRSVQAVVWGVVVAEPRTLYDRDFGHLLQTARVKIAATESGDMPPIAPTFAESTGE